MTETHVYVPGLGGCHVRNHHAASVQQQQLLLSSFSRSVDAHLSTGIKKSNAGTILFFSGATVQTR